MRKLLPTASALLGTQIRNASFKVGKGQITIEEAIPQFGLL